MIRRSISIGVVASAVLLLPAFAWSQQQGGGGQGGGGQGGDQQGGGQGGGGTGQNAGGQQLLGGADGAASAEGAGQISDDARYLRENRQIGDVVGAAVPATGFVGQAGMQQGAGGAAGGRAQGLGGLGGGGLGGGGFMSLFGGGLNQLNQSNFNGGRRQLRIPLRLGFTPTLPPQRATVGNVHAQITRMPQALRANRLSVRMEGSTAVLRGTVPTEHAGRLAVQLALLEPGVSDVRSELTVAPSSSSGTLEAPVTSP